MYTIVYTLGARDDLLILRAYDRTRIMDDIDANLGRTPTTTSVRRKLLRGMSPTFDYVPPLWQLRVGSFRVFYDVDESAQTVMVRAIVHKGRKTTGEVL